MLRPGPYRAVWTAVGSDGHKAHGDFSFTPELSWNNLVQWDTDSDTIGVNSRLRWIPVPEQEIFLVLNESLDGTVPLFQELSFKITYVLRF